MRRHPGSRFAVALRELPGKRLNRRRESGAFGRAAERRKLPDPMLTRTNCRPGMTSQVEAASWAGKQAGVRSVYQGRPDSHHKFAFAA